MPSTGTPRAHTASLARGLPAAVTDSGPPESTMPLGANVLMASSPTSQGISSQYTPASRTRRAMSWQQALTRCQGGTRRAVRGGA